jgi:large subunit ribosomal protein L25
VTLVGVGEEKDALIHDVERDPVTGAVRHVDFYVLEKGKKVEVEVPLTFVGISPAVKDMGGTLVKVMHKLAIEALPKDLPRAIEVDIAALVTFESKIHVKDLVLPSGVEAKTNSEEVVALVAEYKEEVEETIAPIDLSAIEVEKKGKEANVEEGAEAGPQMEEKPEKK